MSARSHEPLLAGTATALHVIVLAGRWAVVGGDEVLSEHVDAERAERAALEHARTRHVDAIVLYDLHHNPHVRALAHDGP